MMMNTKEKYDLENENPLAGARGILAGVVFSIPIWAIIFIIIHSILS